MNQKERNELRRRFKSDRSGISRIYGCYVSGGGQIISRLELPLGTVPEDEAEMYYGLLKKVLSGTAGKNLIDLVFSTKQVMEGEEHKLLMRLRDTGLEDEEIREEFYQKVISGTDLGNSSYLILLGLDNYDVPYRGKDDEELADGSDTVFTYFACCVCPVKDQAPRLHFVSEEQAFHRSLLSQAAGAPELGFLFPCFDDRAANIYNVLYYTRDPGALHQGFIDAVFHTEQAPVSAVEQKDMFNAVLIDTLSQECSLDVVQAVHEQLCERLEEHKASKNPEAPEITLRELGDILQDSGVSEERTESFRAAMDEAFGRDCVLNPENIIEKKKFEIHTPEVQIRIDPASSYLIETRVIDGRRYLLIPADKGVEVNGVPVTIEEEPT